MHLARSFSFGPAASLSEPLGSVAPLEPVFGSLVGDLENVGAGQNGKQRGKPTGHPR